MKKHHTNPVSKRQLEIRREIKMIKDSFEKNFPAEMTRARVIRRFPKVSDKALEILGFNTFC